MPFGLGSHLHLSQDLDSSVGTAAVEAHTRALIRSAASAEPKSLNHDEGKKSSMGSDSGDRDRRDGGGDERSQPGRDDVPDDTREKRPARNDEEDSDMTPKPTPITRSRNHTPTSRDASQRTSAATADVDAGGDHINDGGGSSKNERVGGDTASSNKVLSAGV